MSPKPILLLIAIFIGSLFACNTENEGHNNAEATSHSGGTELAHQMAFMQRYAEKAWFAGEAEHWELVDFYLHELEETAESIVEQGIEEDGVNISALAQSILIPSIESVEEAVDTGNLTLFKERHAALIQSCNSCHIASKHSFLKFRMPETNPYTNQDFSK